ncbi:N-acetyltransferase [Desulfolucanica intricata]|uniref:N-acetyltransferase n=1 Tax=Desulfolucanica intricata TaxID=1285191 RepID=UPI00082FF439|nr:N-acetyltransferase [Desulfolucanica intricata]
MILRKAKISDVEAIHSLVNFYAGQRLMLGRPRSMIYENLREFTVAEQNGEIVGVGALHITWEDLAEVRALAVATPYTRQGIGRELVNVFLDEARELGIPKVFSLTYQPGFFAKCGFKEISKDLLPQKVWKECVNCPEFPNCDEQAVLIELTNGK